MVYGRITRWYPYPFVDASTHGYGRVLVNGLSVVVVLLVVTSIFWLGDQPLPMPGQSAQRSDDPPHARCHSRPQIPLPPDRGLPSLSEGESFQGLLGYLNGVTVASSGELVGKVAVVTGAGSGIGFAIAELFAANGAAVAINFLGHGGDAQKLAARIAASGGRAEALEADVSKPGEVESLIATTVERFGRLDVLVNNAGIEKAQPLLEVDEANWDRTLAVDLKGPFLCLQAAAKRMK